jgi:hypothetical protein
MPKKKKLNPLDEFIKYYGYKPHGNNKQFKKLKESYGLDKLSTPKQKKDFLKKVVNDKKVENPAKIIQKAMKIFANKRINFVNNFKKDLLEKNQIQLKRRDIIKYTNIKKIIEIIQDNIDMNSKNVSIQINNDMYYTLTPENIKLILNLVKEGILEEGTDIYEDSKTQIIYKLLTAENITINSYDKTNKNKSRAGSFFPYYLKEDINIDLDELQIYKKYSDNNQRNLDNCLLFALKQYGIEEHNLECIKDMIKLKNIPLTDIKKVCDKLKICIKITFIKENIDKKNKTQSVFYGKEYSKNHLVNIGYVEKHYILIKKSNYTAYSIKNYDLVKDLPNFNMIYDKRNLKCNKRFIDTLELISLMMQNKDYFFEKIDAGNINKYDEIYINKLKDNSFESLEYTDDDYRLVDFDKTKIEPDLECDESSNIVYFDFETGKFNRNDKIYVEPFLCCTIDNQGNKNSFVGENCAYKMLKSLKNDTILIAHNAKFDYTFLTTNLWKCKEICNGSSFITFSGYFGKIKIQIKDSVRLIPMKLNEFPKAFNLDCHKEFMPYDLYTGDNIKLRFIKYDNVLDYIKNDKDKELFDENIKKWDLLKYGYVDMIEYARRYCEIDVEVLQGGYNIFRDNCITHFNIDVNKILTIPTLADKYFIIQGCYDDVYELAGQPRQFIENCIVGGRTMTCKNKKHIKENVRINDFDAVSLYPSSMYRINGFLKGLPKILTNLDYDIIKNYDDYFIQIKIKKIGIQRKFPLCSYVDNEKGVRNFTNDLEGRIVYIDKTGLEDLINFQNVEFDIIKGYYFNEGFNNKIKDVISFIFNKRIELKKEKNVSQLIYKLIMNSGYGKAIQKSHDTATKLFDSRKDFDIYLSKNYNIIKNWIEYNDGKKFKATIGTTMINHFNRCHIGVGILSMSKRIMNEVICLAEDNELDIYYQDTDSIHIEDKDIKVLSKLYQNKYNRELIGNNLGQFHSDFELDGAVKDIIATNSIILGKKSYIDKLTGKDNNNNIINGYHYRMKGIPSNVIEYYCSQNNIDVYDLYKQMYNGDKIQFDLTCGGKAFTIKHNKNYTINILDDFKRTVCFK